MLADDLKKRREALGLTKVELARALDVAPHTVYMWEQHRQTISHPGMVRSTLALLARQKREKGMYIEIRDRGGNTLIEEQSKAGEDYPTALIRLYKKLTGHRNRHIATDEYFKTAAGYPVGTHHVQMGYSMQGGHAANLDELIVVAVSET